MASLDDCLNLLFTFKECSFCGTLYNKECYCSSNQRHCFHCKDALGDGFLCRRCTCMRCGSGLSKGLCLICASRYGNNPNPNSLNDSQNISENVSQSPPPITQNCCYKCEEPLDGFFCHQCTCKSCGKGAHYGYNCPPQVPIISNPEPCNNQTIDELPQTLPSVHPTCNSGDENSFTYDSKPNFVDDSPNVFNPPSQPPTYSCKFYGNDAHYGYDCPPQVPFIYNPEPCYTQDFNFPQNFHSFQQYLCCTRCGGPHETFQCQQVIFYEPCCENYRGPHETFQCDQLIFDEPYCENCGGPHETFQCQPVNENYYEPNFCYDSNSFGFDQVQPPQSPVIHQPPQETTVEMLQAREDLMESIETFLKKFNRISFRETPKVLIQDWDTFFEIKHACKEKQHQPEVIQELLNKLLNDVKIISEVLAEFINSPSWNHPAIYYDDDEDYTIAIIPDLATEEPVNSLSMGDKHLDTIPATESDEVIKSSVENLVLIPSESKGIPDKICDVPFCNNPTTLEASKDHSEIVVDFNDDSTSSDDDSPYGEDIDYVNASPPDAEIVSLKVVEIVIPKVGGIDDDILLTIKDDILCEKLLNVNLLIANIEALKDNPTPSFDFVTKSSSTSLNLFLEETNTFDNSLPESETFCFDLEENSSGSTTTRSDYSLPDYEAFYNDHIEEKSSGSTTTHSEFSLSKYDSFIFDLSINPFPPADRSDFYHEEFTGELAHIISPPEYDRFYFKNEPESGDFTMDVVGDIFPTREPRVHVPNVLNTHPTLNLDFILSSESLLAYVVWIFLPFLTYPVTPPYLLSCGNEDTIFDPGISIYHSFMPDVSHRSGTFMKFNVYPNHLNGSPMEILNSTCSPMDQ
ncbi:hypothetical protein Tco_0890142 [Tanacetum coccineum]